VKLPLTTNSIKSN